MKKQFPMVSRAICLFSFLLFLHNAQAQTCDYVEGDITFNASGGNVTAGYANEYLLVNNATGEILQRTSSTTFTAVTEGTYDIYNVNYETATSGGEGTSVTGIAVGDNISGVGGICYSLSAALPVTVCRLQLEWTDFAATNSESVTSYQPTLNIIGGDISGVSMPTTVEVALTGAATAGSDYNPNLSTITLTIPKADYSSLSSLNFNDLTTDDFSVIDDVLQENNEDVVFTLQNATGLSIADADGADGIEVVHTYMIQDNDVLLVEWVDAGASDNEATGGNLPSLIVSGAEIGSAATVEVALSGTATAGTDYAPGTTITVTIPAADYQTTPLTQALNDFSLSTADLSITDDQTIEGDETVILTLQNATNVTIGDADAADGTEDVHTYTILDDDVLLVEFTTATGTDSEGSGGNLAALNLSGAVITSPVTIEAALVAGGTATDGSDFALASGSFPISLTIPAGDYTGVTSLPLNGLTTQDLTITDDATVEASETFTLELQNASGLSIGDADGADGVESQFAYTITDDDCAAAARTLSK